MYSFDILLKYPHSEKADNMAKKGNKLLASQKQSKMLSNLAFIEKTPKSGRKTSSNCPQELNVITTAEWVWDGREYKCFKKLASELPMSKQDVLKELILATEQIHTLMGNVKPQAVQQRQKSTPSTSTSTPDNSAFSSLDFAFVDFSEVHETNDSNLENSDGKSHILVTLRRQ